MARSLVIIRRGASWGEPGSLEPGDRVVSGDGELRALVEAARRAGDPIGRVGLLGGDLCRTVGGPGDASRLYGPDAVRLPLDIVRVEGPGGPWWFVAHLVAHSFAWRGEAVAAMNAEWLGHWKLGPRAHPNDGLVDLTRGQLGWRDRLTARRRATTGDHVPHPHLATTRVRHATVRLGPPTRVWLDGVTIGRMSALSLHVEPDALTMVV